MRFADPSVCPSCAAPISGRSICTKCGFDLTSHTARELWQTLLHADALLERARSAGATTSSSPEPAVQVASLPKASALPKPPVPRKMSTGSVLLGLGALFILVAGIIFISVSWGSLGVTGRALVLLAFTAVIGLLAAWISRRGLRASAEALWAVFLGLVTVDWFAAWDQGLFGLDGLSPVAAAAGWSAVMFAVGSYVVHWARPRIDAQLAAPMIVAGAAPWVGGAAIGVELFDEANWTPFWAAVVATAFVVVFLLVAMRLRHQLTSILLAIAGAVGIVFMAIAALVEAVENSTAEQLFAERHGLPLLVAVLITIAVSVIERRAALVAATIALLGLVTLIVLPVESEHGDRGAMIVVAGLVVAGGLALRREDPWSAGARIGTGLLGAGLAVAALPWLATVGSMVGESLDSLDGLRTFWSRPSMIEEGSGPWWLAAIVFGALAVSVVLVRWWPEAEPVSTRLAPAAMVIALVGAMVSLAAGEVAFTVAALAAIVMGAALSEAPPRDNLAWSLVGPAVVALAPVLSLPSRSATLVVWIVAAAVLGIIVIRSKDTWRRELTAFAAAGWGLGAVGIATELADQPDRYIALSLVMAAGVGLAVASVPMRSVVGRRGVEAATVLVAAIGIDIATVGDVSLGWLAAIWTVLGAAVSLISLFAPDRPYFRWIGFGALGFAYVLRLVASDVETVEAYTLPFGAVLLLAGLWWMRGRAEVTTVRALGSGLLLALLPSLPLALDEPTELRALLLGVGAFVALATGAAKKWKAPFVIGAVILLLLVLVNVGPLALALPRWVLIASAGALLLGAGVTWEDRVRDGRAVATYVASMR